MPSHVQVWMSPGCAKQRWARELSRHYAVLKHLPDPLEFESSRKLQKLQVVCVADCDGRTRRQDFDRLSALAEMFPRVRFIGMVRGRAPKETRGIEWFAWLPRNASPEVAQKAVAAAFASLELEAQTKAAQEDLQRTENEMEELHRIGVALSATHDADAVLDLILRKCREITSADAGSIYLVEETRPEGQPNGEGQCKLRFKLSQNDSISLPKRELVMPISEKSIAGYVALHGDPIHIRDAYRILRSSPYQFNKQFDREFKYRTRSLLTLPMKNAKAEVLGVMQLINCKRDFRVKLTRPEMVARQVVPFGTRAMQLALSLASQAAVSYENSTLYQDIERLFEGFVQAAVTAIEQRDPATSGHSHRVSGMTCGLAEAVDRIPTGSYADVRFTREQMKEIRYAALLHDFGKVAVREEVLVKAKKLYPGQLGVVQTRFDYACKELEARYEKRKLDLAMRLGPERAAPEIEKLDRELRSQLAELEDANQFVLRANEPTVLPEGNFERLIEIGRQAFEDPRGAKGYLLTPEEIRFLSIPQGSLDDTERLQIESHVVHSFNFLMQIPWTREIRGIPAIARAHHEKLNGTGYPYQLKSDQIPLQAKIMTVCDMFDALAASDRPYKRAVSPDKALQILEMSVREKELDPVLFQLFVDAKIYDLLHRSN
ncbi:MAG TPA: HD domain-containing phosphohydrolase [Candidatus Limnocylindrales bacterium]|nr:HD domain-containing phosphohydrolase [Candidatus Limnocylindrales bacterium]